MAKDMYQKRAERKNKKIKNDNQEVFPKTSINWYPGHMAKTKREIKENLKLVDIIYEVIDARIPYSSKIQDINELINDKKRILIITKYDLCDKEETNKFIKYYEDQGYYVLKYDLINEKNINELFDLSHLILRDKLEKRKEKNIKSTIIRAMVIGIPNVGKSTLINKIVGKNSAVVGNKPGVTKQLSWIRVGKDIELLDTPGILWPKLEQETIAINLASMTAIKEEILNKDTIAFYIIKMLYTYYPTILKEMYDITDIEDFEEVIEIIGRKRGCLQKGGSIDYDRVIDIIINDMKAGRVKNITFDRLDNVK